MEKNIAHFLYNLETAPPRRADVQATEEELLGLIEAFPKGIASERGLLLPYLYGLVFDVPLLPSDLRVKFLTSPLSECVSADSIVMLATLTEEAIDFYQKCVDVDGVVITASAAVSPLALNVTREVVSKILSCAAYDLKKDLVLFVVRVALVGANEGVADIPEFHAAAADFIHAGGDISRVGATTIGLVAGIPQDRVLSPELLSPPGYNVVAHEFGHLVHEVLAESETLAGHWTAFEAAYGQAVASGLWTDTYAKTNEREYFAETFVAYLGLHTLAVVPGFSNGINGREALASYDPAAYAVLADLLPCSG